MPKHTRKPSARPCNFLVRCRHVQPLACQHAPVALDVGAGDLFLLAGATALSGFAMAEGVGLVPAYQLFNEILPTVLLLASGEAWLIGGLTAFFVMVQPPWMLSFNDARYLPRPVSERRREQDDPLA